MTKHKMKLIPFKIESLEQTAKEIPYGVNLCQAPQIWEKGEKGHGVVVAVLDTGIDKNHPDLKNNIVGTKDFTSGLFESGDVEDKQGHGTHVAGTIAANGNIQGVAPEAGILACKVLGDDGSGSYDSIIAGVEYATNWEGENGERVRIINMSLGGSYDHKGLEKAILNACAKGILVVVASGNEGDGNEDTFEQSYPALYNECITVAACDERKRMAYFSNNHLQVDLTAAGVKVLSTFPQSAYARLSGTSMAAPHVAGMLALLINLGEKKFQRSLTEAELFALITQVCCSLGNDSSIEGHGFPELSRFYENC
jgi:major intracellular serine protease